MTRLNLFQRIKRLCTVEPLIIEIWVKEDRWAKYMKPYVNRVKHYLEKEYPEIEFLRTKRTDCLRNFRHPFIAGQRKGYVLKITPNINPYELKKTCIKLETNKQAKRISDIDIYLSYTEKISRKNLKQH